MAHSDLLNSYPAFNQVQVQEVFMVKPPAQKAKLIISLILFVLAFTTPILCLLYLYLKYKDLLGYNFEVGVKEYSLIWMPISTLTWLIAAAVSPNIWLRVLNITFFVLGFLWSGVIIVFMLRQAVGH